jgi:phosphohistidine phosphatase
MGKSKTLYILRHAKAEMGTANQEDHERSLVERGIEAAQNLGKYMVRHKIMPDHVLCSTAERASQTLHHLFPFPLREGAGGGVLKKIPPTLTLPLEGGGNIEVEYSEKAYLASGNELLNLIAGTSEKVNSLLVVAHNPGLHQLCLKLAKKGDEKLLDTMTMKFPTCTFAAIDLGKIAWNAVAKAEGELVLFITPKVIG